MVPRPPSRWHAVSLQVLDIEWESMLNKRTHDCAVQFALTKGRRPHGVCLHQRVFRKQFVWPALDPTAQRVVDRLTPAGKQGKVEAADRLTHASKQGKVEAWCGHAERYSP